jgi:hypothetical protein
LVLIAMSIAWTALAGPAPRRIVLVSVDGLASAGERPEFQMPAFVAVAAAGTAGEARAAGPEPFPAWVELLSGCEPARTGVRDENAVVPPATGSRWPSLAASLTVTGYHALALPADPLAHAGTALAAGFERYDVAAPALSERARVDSALAWLGRPALRVARALDGRAIRAVATHRRHRPAGLRGARGATRERRRRPRAAVRGTRGARSG